MSTPTSLRPPGSMGVPLVGETLAFLGNPFRFLEDRQRRHGNVFKSSVLGRRSVILAGTEGAEAFYNTENINRSGAHPFPLVALFGGRNMAMQDGPDHYALKSMALGAFDHTAISDYLPDMQRLVESALSRLARADEFSAVEEMRRLAIEVIWCNVMGESPGPTTDAITRDYGAVLTGVVSLPIPVPGTPYGRALAARDRLLARIRTMIAARRVRPTSDALSRLLTARAADGRTFTDDEAALEVHHFMIAGFIVYGLLAEVLRRLAEQPQLRERCRNEVRDQAPAGPLTAAALSSLRISTNVILEAKRYVPLVPVAFGRARRTFACGGFQIPEGWTVYLALWLNNRDRSVYQDPDRFDPDRFAPPRSEQRRHPMGFIPQGAEPPTGHRCLGLDYSTVLSVAFLTLLVRGYDWELPAQDLAYNWRTLPPEPRGGLRVKLHARA